MPVYLSLKDTFAALRERSLDRSAQLASPAAPKRRALLQQLASAAQLQMSKDSFSAACALYENTAEQVKNDPRLERDFLQKPVALKPLNHTTPLSWSLERGDLQSAILLAEGATSLFAKLNLSKPAHQAMLDGVLSAMEADVYAVAADITRTDAGELLANARDEDTGATLNDKALAQAQQSVAKVINAVDDNGRTLLHREAMAGRSVTVETLLSWGADVAASDNNGDTPLTLALRSGVSSTVLVLARLAEAGADFNAVDLNGTSMLSLALTHAPADATEYVLTALGGLGSEALADLCAQWLSALNAPTSRVVEKARIFMAQGMDLQRFTTHATGNPFVTVGASDPEFLAQVLEALPHADAAVCTQLERLAQEFLGKRSWSGDELAMLKTSLRYGLTPHVKIKDWDRMGCERDFVSAAAARGDVELVRMLVRAGGAVDDVDSLGLTPIGHAAQRRERQIYDYLLRHGAKDRTFIWCRSHWESPPHPNG